MGASKFQTSVVVSSKIKHAGSPLVVVISSRFNGSTRDFVKYISTPKETLRKIDVSESSIRLKNGWSLLVSKMYSSKIWSDKEEDELIYSGDETFIHQFNAKSDPLYQYIAVYYTR